MKKTLIIVSAVAVVLITILLSVPYFIDANKYKQPLLTLIKDKTGRDINVAGDIKLNLFPEIALTLNKVSVGSQFENEDDLVKANKFIVRIKLFPLLQKKLEIGSFKLIDPEVSLHIKNDGSKNWENTATASSASADDNSAPVEEYSNDIDNEEADATPQHSANDKHQEISKSAKQALKEQIDDEPFEGEIPAPAGTTHSHTEDHHFYPENSDAHYEEEQPDYNNKARKEMSGNRRAKKEIFSLSDIKIVNGTMKFVDDRSQRNIKIAKINLDSSFKQGNNSFELSGLLDIFENKNKGNFSLKGVYFVRGGQYGIDNAVISLDDIEAHTMFVADMEMYKPTIKLAVYINKINLNDYKLAAAGEAAQNASGKTAAQDFSWSDEPIDFSFINKVDMHLNLKVTGLTYKDIETGEIMLNSYIKNNKLTVTIKDSKIFDSIINASASVDKANNGKLIKTSLNIEHLDLDKLPDSLGKVSMLSGIANLQLKLNSNGTSEKTIIRNLTGGGNFKVIKGSIEGLDLLSMLKNATSIFESAHISTKTGFDDISGIVDVKDGIVHNNNFVLKSDALNMSGEGSADLNNLTINYKLTPQYSQDFSKESQEPQAPILITGSLLDPSASLDIKTVVQDLITKQTGTDAIVKKLKTNLKEIAKDPKKNDVIKDLKSIFH